MDNIGQLRTTRKTLSLPMGMKMNCAPLDFSRWERSCENKQWNVSGDPELAGHWSERVKIEEEKLRSIFWAKLCA